MPNQFLLFGVHRNDRITTTLQTVSQLTKQFSDDTMSGQVFLSNQSLQIPFQCRGLLDDPLPYRFSNEILREFLSTLKPPTNRFQAYPRFPLNDLDSTFANNKSFRSCYQAT